MEIFYCRKISDDGTRMLMADYTITCMTSTGLDSTYIVYLAFGLVLIFGWAFGVPAYLARKLYTHRDTIQAGNFMFAGIAPLRPLFIFFKPESYMFEIYFMIEKLLLIGLVSVMRVYINGFFIVSTLSMLLTVGMLCLLVKHRPSKTDPYNVANIVSHILTLFSLLATIVMKFPQSGNQWLSPENLGIFLALAQIPFWGYLIHVSFVNLRKMYHQSHRETKTAMARKEKMHARSLRAREGSISMQVGALRCADGLHGAYKVSVEVAPCSSTKRRHKAAGTMHGGGDFQEELLASPALGVVGPPCHEVDGAVVHHFIDLTLAASVSIRLYQTCDGAETLLGQRRCFAPHF